MAKNNTLSDTLAAIEKKFGKGTIMRMGDAPREAISVISTGIPQLDVALGIGGLPKGRIVEIFGPESSGKTTTALHIVAECQKAGGQAAFIDLEYALDPVYAENLGVNVDDLLISQPDSGESALEVVHTLVDSGQVALIVIDSVAAITTQAELDGEMKDASVAGTARLLSKALRKLVGTISNSKCIVLFINQLRTNVGAYGNAPTEITTGGKALKFYSSVRLDIRRVGSVKSGEDDIGNKVRIKVVKNKLAPPHKVIDVNIIFGEGVSKEAGLLEAALAKGVFERKGSWIVFDGKNFAQGQDKARKALKDPAVYNTIKTLVDNA